MHRPIFKPVGTPADQLDTPALVVDLPALERNIETMHSFFRRQKASLRPHIESHRCPAVAHKQLAAGGTTGGVAVTTVGQAEVFVAGGFVDVLVANVVVTPLKISLLCALARHASITVAVDNPENVVGLSEAASANSVTLNVAVALDVGLGAFGVPPGQQAVDLARAAHEADGLDFAGLIAFETTTLVEDADELARESRKRIQQVVDTREMVEKAGIAVRLVSAGGTSDYDIAAANDGVTEVPAGSYALMDLRHRAHRDEFEPAGRVMGSVTSVPEPGVVITDAGRKSIGNDTGEPSVDNLPGAKLRGLSAEHGSINFDGSADGEVSLGDPVWHTPWDIGACVNLYDYMHGVRDGKLEVVWEVPARGRYR